MSRLTKVIWGLICLSIIDCSQLPMVFSAPSGENRIIYSKTISEGTHGTYVPATAKPYKIRVWYTITGNSAGVYFGKIAPKCHIRNNSQWIVYDDGFCDKTISGSFDVLPGQRAYVEIIAGSAWGIFNSWQIPISETLTYYYDNDVPPAPVLSATNATFLNNAWYVKGPVELTWTAVADNPLSFEASGYYGPSGIKGYKIFDDNNAIPGEYITGTSTELALNEGSHHLTVKAYDNETYVNPNGNESAASNGLHVMVDQSPPVGNIRINDNHQYTNDPNVTLTISNISDNGSGISQICFSNDHETYSEWEPCPENAMTKHWTLAAGDGPKTVFVKFKDALGNETANEHAVQATIILDTTPPSGNIIINSGANLTTSQLVTLTLAAADALSGVASMQFSNDGENFSSPEEFSPTKYWTVSDGEGAKTVYVKFMDNLGNATVQDIMDTIDYDENPVFAGFTPVQILPDNAEWSQDYTVYGQIVVPAGKNLIIRQGVRITVDGPDDSDPAQNGLIVEGNLVVEDGVTFTTARSGWLGIIITGTARVTGASISLAQRGLAMINAGAVTVAGCTFTHNFAGIQVYACNPGITGCVFQDNLYGIKEDEDGRPEVRDCTFSANTIDYYSDSLTKITVDQLNHLPDRNNGGNH